MRKSQLKPWLNKDGSVKGDAELQEISHNWRPDVWREYLSSFEVRKREDVVLPPAEINEFSAEECADMLFSIAVEEKHHLLKLSVDACIRGLAPRQREVIVSHFWNGKTVTEMADSMGVSQQSVRLGCVSVAPLYSEVVFLLLVEEEKSADDIGGQGYSIITDAYTQVGNS